MNNLEGSSCLSLIGAAELDAALRRVLMEKQAKKLKAKPPRRYPCPLCNKVFSKAYNRKAHYRKHSGERPFKCQHPGCGKDFSWRSSLKSHELSHKGSVRSAECFEENYEEKVDTESVHTSEDSRDEDVPQLEEAVLLAQSANDGKGVSSKLLDMELDIPLLDVSTPVDPESFSQFLALQKPSSSVPPMSAAFRWATSPQVFPLSSPSVSAW
eukprot:CAMPEP_0198328484 /NCGR_PEP_ID=MMETSP1450-20131203/15512_1 /TAXON_ID=753684 ORGANISM="Madagascaria erythrocladiodes, Strain CCMP3234" /NCGR_SAMPLE_ID=MMETSP1450 /ASSEMBLY_ACC=CAM_ASM_001115 /LENGTH=211 /DNA_ID=CAMNT_0044032623 /DNA_START=172 /DNA_END=807 /DNA_ORIENTATION=-